MNKLREEFCKENNIAMGLDNIYDYARWLEQKINKQEIKEQLTLTNVVPSDCVEHEHTLEFDVVTIQEISTDSFRVYLPKDDEHVVIIEDCFKEKKTIDVVNFNYLMHTLCSVKDY